MSEVGVSNGRKAHHSSSRGLLNNYRYLARKTMVLCAVENAKARKKRQRENKAANLKRTWIKRDNEKPDTTKTVKKRKLCPGRAGSDTETSSLNPSDAWAHVSKFELQLSCPVEANLTSGPKETKVPANHLNFVSETRVPAAAAPRERCELDSGFSSEASPPASGRGSPCPAPCPALRPASTPAMVVAMDCEMVGTGPGGRCSELARCSLLDYHGNVIYDKYIRPCQPVTDYRTRWSGIQRHHLQNALPFLEARREILEMLKGKVVVGHALFNDFQALDFNHPGHMVRDTSSTCLLRRLAGYPVRRCISLKVLANKLLDRKIQVGRRGHCSVEDARAALDLYKLVEGEWEQDLRMRTRDTEHPDPTASNHYMQDRYWPENLAEDSQ